MNNILSSRQLAFLVFLFMLGSSIIYVPESLVGQDAWASSILASLLGLYVLWAIIYIQKQYPGISIFKISEKVLGKAAGKFINLIYTWMLVTMSMAYLYDINIFLLLLFPGIPRPILAAIILLPAAFILYHGLTELGRLADSIVFLTLFFLLLALALSLSIVHWDFLHPVLQDWKPVFAGAFYGANWPYAEVSFFCLLLPFAKDLKEKSRYLFIWYGIGVVLLVLRSVLVIAILGPELTSLARFPFYTGLRLLHFENFQRIELFFFLLYFLTSFTAVVLCYQILVIAIKELFSLPDYRSIILPSAAMILALSLANYSSDISFSTIEAAVIPFQNLPIRVLYPTIILFAILIRD